MKTKMPFYQAYAIAIGVIEKLTDRCERIEVAGSLRRRVPHVGDIELVAIPKFLPDMFGAPSSSHMLDTVDWTSFGIVVKSGHKFKQIELVEGITLDLFIVTPPAQWGVIFLLRTGPEVFSHQFVKKKSHGGMLPSNMEVKHGALRLHGFVVETPEEIDVFKAAGLAYIEPKSRV